MLPPAPGRLSTTTDCPQRSFSFCPTMRASTSVPPPGAKGAISRIGFIGYV